MNGQRWGKWFNWLIFFSLNYFLLSIDVCLIQTLENIIVKWVKQLISRIISVITSDNDERMDANSYF